MIPFSKYELRRYLFLLLLFAIPFIAGYYTHKGFNISLSQLFEFLIGCYSFFVTLLAIKYYKKKERFYSLWEKADSESAGYCIQIIKLKLKIKKLKNVTTHKSKTDNTMRN